MSKSRSRIDAGEGHAQDLLDWREGRPRAGADPREERAAALLRAVLPPRPLADFEQVAVELREVGQRRGGLAALGFGSPGLRWAVAASVVVVVGLLGWRLNAPRSRAVEVMACALEVVDDGAGRDAMRAVLIGPATATVSQRSGGPVKLARGRLLVRAGAEPRGVLVVAASAEVKVAPASTVEIRVERSEMVVAAYVGSATVEQRGTVRVVAAGQELLGGEPRAVDPRRALEAREKLDPAASASGQCEAPIAAVAPAPPVPAPVLAPAPAPPPPTAAIELPPEPIKPEPRRPVAVAIARETPPPAPAPPAPTPPPERVSEEPRSQVVVAADPPVATPPVPEPPSGLSRESTLLGTAVKQLRTERRPAQALATLDEYDRSFPRGVLQPEARATRVETLLALGRRDQALAALETLALDRLARGNELRVVRGELRAERGRCAAAVDDFSHALDRLTLRGPSTIIERALYGRGSCQARLGQTQKARADLATYLERFPRGSFAATVRQALAR